MPRSAPSSFSAEHIAEFHRRQAQRPVLMRQMSDNIKLWRWCGDKRCSRSRACQSAQAACLTAFLQGLPDHERRMLSYALAHRRDGVPADEAFRRAQERVAAEMAADA